MVDMSTVHIGGSDVQRLRTASSTNTVTTEDLADVVPIRDGVGSSGELQRVKAMGLRVVTLGPSRRDEGEPWLVRLHVSRNQSF
jgi:hypothetical protein